MCESNELVFEQPIQYRAAQGAGMLRSVEEAIECCGRADLPALAEALEHAKEILLMARDTRSRPAVAAARHVIEDALAEANLLHS